MFTEEIDKWRVINTHLPCRRGYAWGLRASFRNYAVKLFVTYNFAANKGIYFENTFANAEQIAMSQHKRRPGNLL